MSGLSALVEDLVLGTSSDRHAAAYALGRLGDVRAARPLALALADDDPSVRGAVIEALLRLGEAAVPALAQRLAAGPQVARYHAAEVLGEVRGGAAAACLMRALVDTDPDVRWQITQALAKCGELHAVPDLCECLADRVPLVRRGAADALRRLPDPSAVPALVRALADADPSVADAASLALAGIGETAVAPLCEALEAGSMPIRLRAARTLGQLGQRSALPALRDRIPVLGLGGERHAGVLAAIREAIIRIERTTMTTSGLPRSPGCGVPDPRGRPRAPGSESPGSIRRS